MEVAEPRARQPPTLPMDMLLEIIARSDDVTTVVRCAVRCKPLRRAMLGPGFIDRLRRRAEANGGFDPSLIMAVSCRLPPSTSIVVQPPGRLRFDTDLLSPGSCETATSRDGLLVVQRHGMLLVCNTITGHVTAVPRTGLGDSTSASREMFQPALLSVDGAGRSFELLVTWRWSLGAQIFCSQEDKWGATREILIHNPFEGVRGLMEASSSAPAVVGRSVHWLCYIPPNRSNLMILALHAESAHASVIRLPQELLTRIGPSPVRRHTVPETRILATTTTVEGKKRLSLVVAGRRGGLKHQLESAGGDPEAGDRQAAHRCSWRIPANPAQYVWGEEWRRALLDAEPWARPAQPWN